MNQELRSFVDSAPLIDHHCHGVWRDDLDSAAFEQLATESEWREPEGTSVFDSPFGIVVRAECAPILDLPRHTSGPEYVERRLERGVDFVNRAFLAGTGISRYIVETGVAGTDLLDGSEIAAITGASSSTVVRLELIAEQLLEADDSVGNFIDRFATALDAQSNAVGYKTIIAYRWGLDFDPTRPSPQEVTKALGAFLAGRSRGTAIRMTDPTVMRHLIWAAVDRKRVLQVHVGYGDADINLYRCDPTRMTEFLRLTRDSGTQITLLHCYPFQREASFLTQIFPHVYLDTGAAVGFTGHSSAAVIRESLELAPMHKVLFSTDAYALPELYFCGAHLWRRSIGDIFGEWLTQGRIGLNDARRYTTMMASENAERVYQL